MSYRTKIIVDRYVGAPLALGANAIARVLGAVMHRDHTVRPENVKKIVVAKFLGMGSIVQASPLLRALKEHFPGAKLIFLTTKPNFEITRRLSDIDEVLLIDDSAPWKLIWTSACALAKIVSMRIDVYFDLEVYSAFSSLMAIFAISRNRVGFFRKSAEFKSGLYTHLVYFNARVPVRQLYLQLARVAGAGSAPDDTLARIAIEPADRDSADRFVAQQSDIFNGDDFVMVNPNASELLLERRWPAEHFIEAISQIVRNGRPVMLIGSPNERPFVESIFDRLPTDIQKRVCNSAGKLSLGTLLAVIETASCVLTNDTGPMHLATALGRPTVCLFGPVSPEHYGYTTANVRIMYRQVICSPCVHELDTPPCDGNNVCMQLIEPVDVVNAVESLIASPHSVDTDTAQQGQDIPIITETPNAVPLGVVVRASIR